MFTVTINPNQHNSYFLPHPSAQTKKFVLDSDGVHLNTMTINAPFTRIRTVLKPHTVYRIRVDSGP